MNEKNKKLVVIDWNNSGIQVAYMYGTPKQIFKTLEKYYGFNPDRDTAIVFKMSEIWTMRLRDVDKV